MKTQNSKTAATITAETGGENPTALHHDVVDIRERAARGYRRSVFVPGFPEINTAAIRTCFDMGIEYLKYASFIREENMFGDNIVRSGIEMMLVRPQEKLVVTVYVCSRKKWEVPQTYDTRVVHCANRLDEGLPDEDAEYETTQVYLASGVLNDHARDIFAGEQAGLEKYARTHLKKAAEVNPFCHWQFIR